MVSWLVTLRFAGWWSFCFRSNEQILRHPTLLSDKPATPWPHFQNFRNNREQKRHINLCPVTPVTDLPGRVPGQKDLYLVLKIAHKSLTPGYPTGRLPLDGHLPKRFMFMCLSFPETPCSLRAELGLCIYFAFQFVFPVWAEKFAEHGNLGAAFYEYTLRCVNRLTLALPLIFPAFESLHSVRSLA